MAFFKYFIVCTLLQIVPLQLGYSYSVSLVLVGVYALGIYQGVASVTRNEGEDFEPNEGRQ